MLLFKNLEGDGELRNTSGYVGAFALDAGNPVQRHAFYDHLLQLGWRVAAGRKPDGGDRDQVKAINIAGTRAPKRSVSR